MIARDLPCLVAKSRQSGGFAIAVDDDAILAARNRVAYDEGVLLCPEGAATFAAYEQGMKDGRIGANERVVLYNCATGLKYPMPSVERDLDRNQPVDYEQF